MTLSLTDTVLAYTSAGLLQRADGPWNDDTVSFAYNNQRLRQSLSLAAPNSAPWLQTYGYDPAERLTNTTSPAGGFRYAYDPLHSTLPALLTLPSGAYITNNFDPVARLLSTALKNSTNGVLNSHTYGYNLAGQRMALANVAGDYRSYSYDLIGQLKTAVGREAGGATIRAQEKFGYSYDAAGNLSYRTNNLLVQAFNVNSLNELAGASRTGTFTVAGTTTGPATNVTVNDLAALLYADNTFAKPGLTLIDGTNTFTAVAQDNLGRTDTNSAICNLPSAISFTYDLNGNLLSES